MAVATKGPKYDVTDLDLADAGSGDGGAAREMPSAARSARGSRRSGVCGHRIAAACK